MGSARRAGTQRRGLLLVLAALVAAACFAAPSSSGATSSGINLRLDYETGDNSQFTAGGNGGVECPNPATQFAVYSSHTGWPTPRQGQYATMFHETSADVWSGNNIVRCLDGRYDTGETTGNDYWYGLSIFIPSPGLSDNLIWELHHPSSLYNVANCGVAPFALTAHSGALVYRIFTGNCTPGAGDAYINSNIPLPGLNPMPTNQWVDFVFHINFQESNTGQVQVWARVGSNAWPTTPQLSLSNIPTMPFCSSCGVHNVKLYTEMGLYSGYSSYTGNDSVFLDGYRRGTTRDSVMAEFPGSGVQQPPSAVAPVSIAPPAVTGSAVDGVSLAASTGTWSNTPSSYGYAWQSSRDGGATWQAIAGASGSTFALDDTLVGASIRAVVTASNITGSASATSVATSVVAPPTIVQNVSAGQTLSGVVNWTATPSAPVQQVVFALDGKKVTYTDTTAPYTYALDTTKLATGTHALGLTVTLLNGTVVWQPYQIGNVTVANAAVVAPAATTTPAVSGSAVDGATLNATPGTWSNTPTTYAYAWQSSRDNGVTWQAVAGATASSLTLDDSLVGTTVRCVVTASNLAGTTSAASATTAAVAPPTIVQNISAGQTLSGVVTWTATPSAPVKQVVFALDGNRIDYTDASAPYTYQLDTTKLANGTHTFGLTVTLLNGAVIWQPYQVGTVTVSNPKH